MGYLVGKWYVDLPSSYPLCPKGQYYTEKRAGIPLAGERIGRG